MNETAFCLICRRGLWDDEQGRYACRLCEQRIDRDLYALAGPAGLYARVCLRNDPAQGGHGPAVTATRTPGIPGSLDVLDLTADGGMVTDLETWVTDWASYGLAQPCRGGRLQHRVDEAVATLRLNLPQAVGRHPAIDEFSKEIGTVRRRCEGIIGQEPGARRFGVLCPCGRVLTITLDTPGKDCAGCGVEYGHAALFELPLAVRAAA